MRHRVIINGWIAGICAAAGSQIWAADKNGVSPQVISLPSGPGSISGLGESFQPQLNSGSGAYSIPIQLPKGPAGFAPSLSLQYHTGNGNGIVGIGWKLGGATMISRNMDNGLPLYVDANNGADDDFDGSVDNPEEIDRFSGLDLEELVPLPNAVFRSESEESFLRYERIGAGWQARSKGGVLHEFGVTSSARIEKTDGKGTRIFSWLLERSTDLNGNTIEYRYMPHPSSLGQKYCREIRWAGTSSFYAAVMIYEERPRDVHSDFRSGFEVRTGLRLARIDVIAQGVPTSPGAVTGDLNEDGQTNDFLIRRYVLEYKQNALQSLLHRVTMFGSDGLTKLPSMTFDYTEWEPPNNVSSAMSLSSGDPDAALNSPDVELIDMNNDGLPDLLQASASEHRVYVNLGVDAFDRLGWDTVGVTVKNAPGLNLGATAVHLADHSADGESDLINKINDSTFQCFINSGQQSWQDPIALGNTDSWPRWPFETAGSRTLDTDHNRMHDILFTSDNSYSLWMLMPGGRYGREVPLPVLADDTQQAFSFAHAGARIADANGDRISDIVWIQSTQVVYWASCGRGNFEGPILLPLAESLSTDEIARSDFADINGDGLSDLIIVRPTTSPEGIHYYLNLGRAGFDELRTIVGLPSALGTDAMRCADMNGNGSADLLISNGARDPGTRQQYLDFVPGIRPHLLRRVDNGLGLVTTLEYETSIQQMVRARTAGQDWTSTMPISVPVVARITEDDSRGNAYTREITYRDPYYDPAKQEFRGFSRVELKELGDASSPTKVTLHVFDTGIVAACRKGKLLAQEVLDEATARFERVENTVQHRVLDTAADGRQVCFAFDEATDAHIYERTSNPVHIRTEYQYDDFGNVLHENKHGIAGQDGDEVFVEKEYEYRPATWLMDRVSRSTIRDGQGVRAAEDQFSYDARGNLREQRRWLNVGDRYIVAIRNEYDSFGNVIRMTDANKHSRSVAYDALLHTYPVAETVHLESRDLVTTATYDMGFGTVLSATDFASATSNFEYDALARQSAIFRPGGAETRYTYELGAPISRIITKVREQVGGGTFDTNSHVDGYGRALGSKIEAEDGQWRFVDAVNFNRRKLETRRWLPYFTSSPAYEAPNPTMPFTAMSYDAKGRLIETVDPDGDVARTVFEPLVQHVHDENDTAGANTPKTQRSDGLERLVEVTERNGPEDYNTRYAWSTQGDLLEITDAQGNKKFMGYDSLKRNVSLNDPDRGIMSYEHDDMGNLLRTTDAKGQVILYAYDFANRLVSENYLDQGGGPADPVDVRYVYDLPSENVDFGDGTSGTATFTGGRLSSVIDLSGAEHESYDGRGNILWTVKRIRDPMLGVLTSYKTGFTYDVMDRLAEVVYPDNDRCGYSYNSASFLESIDGGLGGKVIIADAAYEPTGQLSHLTYGNDVATTYAYDDHDRLASLRTVSPKVGDLIHYSYAYDPVSNITKISDKRPFALIPETSPRRNTQMFQYDDLYRLTQVKYSPNGDGTPTHGQIDYAYGKIGNMLSQTTPSLGEPGHIPDPKVNLGAMTSGGAAGTHNRTGRLPGEPPGPHALTATATATATGGGYEYDDNGNMTDLEGATLTWDFKDRLARFQKDDVDARYTYDYTGRRITKLVTQGGGTDQTLYVGPNFEYRPNRAPTKYVFNGATRVAQVKGALDPSRQRAQRIWLSQGWNLLTVAVSAFQTPADLFGQGAVVHEWTGTQYGLLSDDAIVPTGTALWVNLPSAGVVTALGSYDPPTDAIAIPGGQSLVAWPKLEPLVFSEHLLSSAGRIRAYEAVKDKWLLIDPSLPSFLTNPLDSLPSTSAFWLAPSAPTGLLPTATEDRDVVFYHGDHLGSANVMTDSHGVLVEATSYYPFGAVRHSYAPGPDGLGLYGFTQKEQDAESDLHYFEARYLNADFSRFVTPDVKFLNPAMLLPEDLAALMLNPQKLNLYSYVENNPLKYIDPTGLERTKQDEMVNDITGGMGALADVQEVLGAPGGPGTAIDAGELIYNTVRAIDDPSDENIGAAVNSGFGLIIGLAGGPLAGLAWYGLNAIGATDPIDMKEIEKKYIPNTISIDLTDNGVAEIESHRSTAQEDPPPPARPRPSRSQPSRSRPQSAPYAPAVGPWDPYERRFDSMGPPPGGYAYDDPRWAAPP